MISSTTPLPAFTDPPVVEVALGVQFEPLTELGTAQLGLVWQKFRQQGFLKTEDHPRLESSIEEFGVRRPFKIGLEVNLVDAPPVPRLWLQNDAGTELIQVQQDRFIHNWRKVRQGEVYPRYGHLRRTFERELGEFQEHLRDEALGELVPTQCEVTYVNEIPSGAGWDRHGRLDEILTVWQSKYSDTFLPEPEDVRLRIRYVINDSRGTPLGRLNVSVEPAYRLAGDQPIVLMTLTARGKPDGSGVEGVLRFLDWGRDWLVRGFTSITTQKMHDIWGRDDGHRAT